MKSFAQSNTLKSIVEFKFSSNIQKTLSYSSYASIYTEYNSDGKKLRVDTIERDGASIRSFQHIYNDENALLEMNCHDEDSNFVSRQLYFYNNGNLSRIEHYNKNGKLARLCHISYPIPSIKKQDWLNAKGDTLASQEYLLINNRVLQKKEKYKRRRLELVRGYAYNSQGEIQIQYNQNNFYSQSWKDSFAYEFDESGNWIRKIEFSDDGKRKYESYRLLNYNMNQNSVHRHNEVSGYWVSQDQGRIKCMIYLSPNDSAFVDGKLISYLRCAYWNCNSQNITVNLKRQGTYSINVDENIVEIRLDDDDTGQLFLLSLETGEISHSTLPKTYNSPLGKWNFGNFVRLNSR